MSLSEVIEKITLFGKEIINSDKANSSTVVVPKIEVTADETISLINQLKNEQNSEYDVGFYNIADKIISENWEKMNDSQKNQIRDQFLKATKTQINQKASNRFAALCVKIYVLSENNWKELLDFVFSIEDISIIKIKIFVRLLSSVEEDFMKEHFNQIVAFLTKSLPIATPALKDKLINVLSNIDSELAFETEKTLLDIFMESLFAIMKEEPERQELIIPVANTIFVQSPKAAEIVPKSLTDAIMNIKDIESAEPILGLFPVYNAESIIALVTKLIALAESMIKENKCLPVDLLSLIAESPIEKLSESVSEALAQFFQTILETTASAANVAIFAPLAAQVADIYGKDKFLSIVNSCFKGTDIQLCAALYIYQSVSEYMDNLSFDFPQSVLTQIFQYFGNPNEQVRASAFTAARKLLENKFEFDQETCQALFDSFSSIPDNDFVKFFKVVREAFRAETNDAALAQCGIPFALEGINANKSQPNKVAEYLSIFANIANSDPDVLEEHCETIVSTAMQLMKSDNISTYKYASRALLGLLSFEDVRPKIFSLLPRFSQLVSKESTLPAQVQGNVAAAYASIVIGAQIDKEIPKIVDIAMRFVSSNDKYLISAGSLLAEMVVEMVKLDVARQLFATISEAASTTQETESLNNLLEALGTIFEKSRVEQKAVIPLFDLFVKGEHPVFNGKPIFMFHDKDTNICAYLKNCVTRFPELGEQAATMASKWFSMAPAQMFPALLDVLTTVVEMKKVEGENFDILAESLFQRIGTTHNDDLDEIIITTLLELVKEKPEAIDPQRFVSKFIILYEAIDQENPSPLNACISAAILDMCAYGAYVEHDTIKDILLIFPGQPDDDVAEEMGSSLVKMMTTSDKWNDLKPHVATVLSSVLLKPQEEYNKYGFEKETTLGMKKLLKSILQANKELERSIIRSFNKNRSLQNRFSKLMK